MGFNDQASFAGTVTRGTATGPGEVLTTDAINVGGFDFTNPTGAAGVVTLRDGTQTNVQMTASIPANSTRSLPGAHFADGLSISSPVAITYAIPIFDPPSVKTAWSTAVPPFTNATSTQFNPTSFNGRILGPTDTAIHTSAPIGDFSGSLWYQVESALGQFQGPVGSATSFAFADGYGIYRGTADTSIFFFVGSFSSGFSHVYGSSRWAVGTWYHLAYYFDATNRQYTVWSNGVQSQSGINAAPASRPLGGANVYGSVESSGTNGAHFEGTVDEPAYWLASLSQSEVDALYNGGVPVDPTTVKTGALWHLRMGDDPSDDETITTGQVTDQTANGNDFTPTGANAEVNFVADVP